MDLDDHYFYLNKIQQWNIALVASIAFNEEWHEEFEKADLTTAKIPWFYSVDNFYGHLKDLVNIEVSRPMRFHPYMVPYYFPNQNDHSLYGVMETPLGLPDTINTLEITFEAYPLGPHEYFTHEEDQYFIYTAALHGKKTTYGTIVKHMLKVAQRPLQGRFMVDGEDSGTNNIYEVVIRRLQYHRDTRASMESIANMARMERVASMDIDQQDQQLKELQEDLEELWEQVNYIILAEVVDNILYVDVKTYYR